MQDFLRGTFGALLHIVLTILGVFFFAVSCVGVFSSPGFGVVGVILGILCLCAAFGIRYWLGTIHRHRYRSAGQPAR